jgi:hypothetical protein
MAPLLFLLGGIGGDRNDAGIETTKKSRDEVQGILGRVGQENPIAHLKGFLQDCGDRSGLAIEGLVG